MTISTLQKQSTLAQEGELWGGHPVDWAEVQEAQCRKLFEAILLRVRPRAGMQLLDLGCGSGMFGAMAATRGVTLCGIDAAAPLVGIARDRVPNGDLRVGDIEALPFAENSFDAAVCINALQFTNDPNKAASEAYRVVRNGGTLILATWGMRGDCEAAAVLASIALLVEPASNPGFGPFALSRAGALESIAEGAGWKPVRVEHVVCEWHYGSIETALRGLLSTGVAQRAVMEVGEERVRDVVTDALEPFRRVDRSYSMHNAFRFLIAEK